MSRDRGTDLSISHLALTALLGVDAAPSFHDASANRQQQHLFFSITALQTEGTQTRQPQVTEAPERHRTVVSTSTAASAETHPPPGRCDALCMLHVEELQLAAKQGGVDGSPFPFPVGLRVDARACLLQPAAGIARPATQASGSRRQTRSVCRSGDACSGFWFVLVKTRRRLQFTAERDCHSLDVVSCANSPSVITVSERGHQGGAWEAEGWPQHLTAHKAHHSSVKTGFWAAFTAGNALGRSW